MHIRHRSRFRSDLAARDITPEPLFRDRRRLLAGMGGLALASGVTHADSADRDAVALSGSSALPAELRLPTDDADSARTLVAGKRVATTMERSTSFDHVSSYNNFYEFGTDKEDPGERAGPLKLRPWTLSVEGAVARPKRFDLEALLGLAPIEERIYRLRCVEGWSMVIPWMGYPLSALLRAVEPTGSAKFVEFTTLADAAQMPGIRRKVLDWPYVEALRLDEAMNDLTLLTLGLYGRVLPKQNGAPVRVVVPWKYGFKSAKSIVRIRLLEEQPVSSWTRMQPSEYGFYANVNPDVDHPRWSQATERRIGEDGLFQRKRKTLPFNGYAEQVASLYTGMDLRRHY